MVARCCAVARRRRRAALILGAASIARSPPTNHRRRPPRGGRPLPHRAPHKPPAQVAHPAGRSRMLIAVHGLALRKASDGISPLNAVVEPGCCRTPPPSSRRQRRAPRARARGFGASRLTREPTSHAWFERKEKPPRRPRSFCLRSPQTPMRGFKRHWTIGGYIAPTRAITSTGKYQCMIFAVIVNT